MFRILQYIGALTIGLVTSLCLFFISRFPSYQWTAIFISVWLVWMVVMLWYEHRRGQLHVDNVTITLLTMAAFLGFMSIVELPWLRFVMIIGSGIVMACLFSWTHSKPSVVHHHHKIVRRLMMMLLVFDAYALMATFFAIALFFQSLPFWILSIVSGALYSGIAVLVWRRYFTPPLHTFLFPASIILFVMTEIVFVIHLLPFGYLVLGLLATWVWYIVQLFFRLHFTPQDIVWRKQTAFLIINGVAFAFLLFFVRWI